MIKTDFPTIVRDRGTVESKLFATVLPGRVSAAFQPKISEEII